jgi:HSP20 family protein
MATNIVRWNPFREMASMQSAMDRMFEDVWKGNFPPFAGCTAVDMPALDIHETDTAYEVAVPLAGINPDDIDVKLHENTLTISGELPQPKVEDNRKVVVQERYYGKFSRSVSLPQRVDSNKVEATYENGVLNLILPKLPKAQPKQISVKFNQQLPSKN